VVLSLLFVDAISIAAAALLSTYLRFGTLDATVAFEGTDQGLRFVHLGFLMTLLWLLMLWSEGLYDVDRLAWGAGQFTRVARSLSMGLVGLILITYLLKLEGLSRGWILIVWALSVVLLSLGRLLAKVRFSQLNRRGDYPKPTLIVGSNAEASDLVRALRGSSAHGLRPVGCLASSQAERLALDWCAPDLPCLGAARELREVIDTHGIDTVVIASTAFDHDVLARMIAELRGLDVDIHISSGLFEVLTSRVLVREIGGVPLISVKCIGLTRLNLMTKRVFDVLLSIGVILAGAPLWLFVVLGIKLTSVGPVFYKQERVGRGGVRFRMYKFRSMVVDADARIATLTEQNEASGPLFKMKGDPRITAIGRWLRKFSIDEFPQLINVLLGEMSLVGPRPPLPSEVSAYSVHDWRRLEVVPGMTGLWQVSGRSSLSFDEMVRLDLFYIENWSVGLDITLLMRTIPAVLLARGAY
jgi:exopolysaccharide biosynthesis polyprenyl glycosylphosphotransferase